MAPDVAERIQSTETAVSRAWLGTDRIMVIEVKDGADVTIGQAESDMMFSKSLKIAYPVGVLVDIRGIRTIERAARELYSKQDEWGLDLRGTAMVIRSTVSRIIANFYLGFNRPRVPVRLFTSVEAARAWLRGLLA